MLHAILLMAGHGGPVTSQTLAKALNTNAVVVRRVMAGLRDHGYVRSAKGHRGGWNLSCDPATVTLLDIYTALGSPPLLAVVNPEEHADCRVEQVVNAALGRAFEDAEAMLLARLGEVTLAMLSSDLLSRLSASETIPQLEAVHGG